MKLLLLSQKRKWWQGTVRSFWNGRCMLYWCLVQYHRVNSNSSSNITPALCIYKHFCCYTHNILISGIEVFDTCGTREIAMRDVFYAVKKALEPRGKLPLLGKDIMVWEVLSSRTVIKNFHEKYFLVNLMMYIGQMFQKVQYVEHFYVKYLYIFLISVSSLQIVILGLNRIVFKTCLPS
jgi:hypothetical protein